MARTGTLYMVADATRFNPDIEQALSAFGRGGLPLYVIWPASGEHPVVLPQVLTPRTVISALNAAAAQTLRRYPWGVFSSSCRTACLNSGLSFTRYSTWVTSCSLVVTSTPWILTRPSRVGT